jgi:hypothetical protein
MHDPDATWNSTLAPPHPPLVAGTGRGPLGVPWGTDRSYSVDIMVSAAITAVIGTGFVALRFYTRFIIISVRSWEDWVVLAAQVCLKKKQSSRPISGAGLSILLTHIRLCIDLFYPHVCGFHSPCGSLP